MPNNYFFQIWLL